MVMWRRCDCNDCARSRAIESELSKLYARELAPMGPVTTRIVEHRILTLENGKITHDLKPGTVYPNYFG